MDHNIIYYFNQFINILVILELLLKIIHEHIRKCQKEVLKTRR